VDFLESVRGPEFLGLYLGWFVVTWIGMMIVRHNVADNAITSLTGLVLFEALGVARYVIGSRHGMQNWEFLFVMMIVGAIFFLARAKNFSSGSGGFWTGSCGGGGCGGGGCGGGGCGGCGGS